MRTPVLASLVAAGALLVAVSGVVAALVVDEDETSGAPKVTVTPSATQTLKPRPSASTTARPTPPRTEPTPSPTDQGETAPPSPALPTPDPRPTGQTVRYTVKPGDTLSDIAYWFTLNGYRQLYEDNRRVIGADPDRIKPGQVYVISGGRMRTTG